MTTKTMKSKMSKDLENIPDIMKKIILTMLVIKDITRDKNDLLLGGVKKEKI